MTDGKRPDAEHPGAAADPDLDGVFSLNPEYVTAAFDDQVLLYHLNRGETISLNETAGILLELLDGQRSTAEIREILQEACPESAADVEGDVDRTLRCLLRHGALSHPGVGW